MKTKVIKDICAQMPSTLEELESISGVGPVTILKYGEFILGLVHQYRLGGGQPKKQISTVDSTTKKKKATKSKAKSSVDKSASASLDGLDDETDGGEGSESSLHKLTKSSSGEEKPKKKRGGGSGGGSKKLLGSSIMASDAVTNLQEAMNMTKISLSDLSLEQQAAAAHVLSGKSAFITGSAGTGKTFLLKYIIQELHEKFSPEEIAITASTGIAAVNIGGQTLHSFAGIGLGRGDTQYIISKLNKNAIVNWKKCKVLVIDEISMVNMHLFELIDQVARHVRRSQLPFGGVQLVVVGDFMQLPPVTTSRDVDMDSTSSNSLPFVKKFCFESLKWEEAGLADNTLVLKTIIRQKLPSSPHSDSDTSGEFIRILNEVREGNPSPQSLDLLNSCLVAKKPLPTDGIIPTRLYCTNRDVDTENNQRLDDIPGEAVQVMAVDSFTEDTLVHYSTAAKRNGLIEVLDKIIPPAMSLKVGAQVMLTRNRAARVKNSETGSYTASTSSLVNGSRGIVVAFRRVETLNDMYITNSVTRLPIVKFDNGDVITVEPIEFALTGPNGEIVAVRKQVPLKLAWAVTIHKSQGCTLTRAELLVSNAFDYGQTYVALSRVTSLEGLWLTSPITKRAIKVHPVAKAYYEKLLM